MTDTGGRAFQAMVHVGSQVTPYVCCGRGAPLLLIAPDDPARARLVALLCASYRVVALAPPALAEQGAFPQGVAAAWLRGVIDGIGLDAPRVLLGPSLAGYAAAAGEVVDGDVLVLEPAQSEDTLLAALAPAPGQLQKH
jgi:hypothetical protein